MLSQLEKVAVVDGNPLCFMSASELGERFRNGSLSPLEVTRAMLDRIDEVNPLLNAYCEVRPDTALAAAAASEQRWRTRNPLSPLDGVPVSVKDHLDTLDFHQPNRGGKSSELESTQDCPSSARLRECGAILIGKTTMPELSVVPVTTTRAWGITRNPVDLRYSPGGSSGGAAAALAGGLCTIAMGSDGGGSIRLPASFTGLYGLKPTFGRVAYYPGQTDRTVAGPLARSITDIALAMNVIGRPDGRDWTAFPTDAEDYLAALEVKPGRLRIGFSSSFGYQHPDPEVLAIVENALEYFSEMGHHVETFDRLCDDPFLTYMTQATLQLHGKPVSQELPPMIASVHAFANSLDMKSIQAMFNQRNKLGQDLMLAFSRYDLIVSPTSPTTAPLVGDFYPEGEILSEANRNLIGYACPFNLVHMPALNVPCGVTADGLPVGLQIAAPRFGDARLLQAGKAFSQLFAAAKPE